jgi:flagella basal body P-ring formation protein FlgA
MTDPVEVVVAKQDAVAGYIVVPVLRYVSATEVGPEVFTDPAQVKGRKAVVDIPAGTPITPDLLEPPPDE